MSDERGTRPELFKSEYLGREVVRCAECRHAQMWWSHGIGRLECDAWSHMRSVPVDPDDYCSRGELRETE